MFDHQLAPLAFGPFNSPLFCFRRLDTPTCGWLKASTPCCKWPVCWDDSAVRRRPLLPAEGGCSLPQTRLQLSGPPLIGSDRLSDSSSHWPFVPQHQK